RHNAGAVRKGHNPGCRSRRAQQDSQKYDGCCMKAIILAGGKGTRLAPYTTVLPKPLMPVGDMPILGLLLKQLHRHGVREVVLAIGHLGALIRAVIGDGSEYGLKVSYSHEITPLGT